MNKFTFTLYNANTIENCKNCEYPNKIQVFDADSLSRAVRYDYVGVELRNNYRKKDNFLSSDCLIFDLGNTKSDNNLEWKTPEDVAEAFPDVPFAVHYSRNNGRMKDSETARPRFRVIFPIERITDVTHYLRMKRAVYNIFPFFDDTTLDAAHFFFGTESANIRIFEGNTNLSEFLEQRGVFIGSDDMIADERNKNFQLYKPDDYSDLGQAEVLARCYSDVLRYLAQGAFIYYDKNVWKEDNVFVKQIAQELTDKQMKESDNFLKVAKEHKRASSYNGDGKPKTNTNAKNEKTDEEIEAEEYCKHVAKMRNSNKINAVIEQVKPKLRIDIGEFDKDGFMLCVPDATYDLRHGLEGKKEKKAEDFNTKLTTVSPGRKGAEEWQKFLNRIFVNNHELIDYVQLICGLIAIGNVTLEALIIAYGSGRNGKSTFWNVIARVLGSYSGKISPEILTCSCKYNSRPEIAEMKGKRLIIASEMKEGVLLNDSVVKQLCSTDEIAAEKKYKDPFKFVPSHMLVLYTNHLPRVSATDYGIWRRLIVIPFNAKIEGSDDIKDYCNYLYENAGESILSWIIEGSRKVIDANYKIDAPQIVNNAISEYKQLNDWLKQFIEDKCIIGEDYMVGSGELYKVYTDHCKETNSFQRHSSDFKTEMEKAGYSHVVANGNHRYFRGITLKDGGNNASI